MRARMLGAIAAALALGVAGTAFATTVAELRYDPPEVTIDDVITHGTTEDLSISRDGADLVFINSSGLLLRDSDPGCENPSFGRIQCPVAGIERIVLNLRKLDDTATQESLVGGAVMTARGGAGEDRLTGNGGTQRLLGGSDDDVLKGGPGGDLIVGGPGTDRCVGGPGRDRIRGCE